MAIDGFTDEVDGLELQANVRLEQSVTGAAPLNRVYKGCTLAFDPEDGTLELQIQPRSVLIPMWGKKANVYVHCSRMREGMITFRDIGRNLTLMVSGAKPQELLAFQRGVRDAVLWNTKGIRPPKSPSPGKKRWPLSEISPTAKRMRSSDSDGEDEEEEEVKVQLCKEQLDVVNKALKGESVFVTGGAGTGKSLVLREIIRRLPKAGTFVTASTGIAACNIGGTTVHQFGGMGRGDASAETIAKNIANRDAGARWRSANTLIIDEISMVCGETFDKLNEVGKILRKNKKPFGGIQVVLCGDFLQLPPVSTKEKKVPLCFQSVSWKECVKNTVHLKQVFRQKDGEFVRILEQIRWGECSDAAKEMLRGRTIGRNQANRGGDGGIVATKLMTHKKDVDAINTHQLGILSAESKSFSARDDGPSDMAHMMDVNCPAQREIVLKEGAQVILLKTIAASEGLVNGARGIIVSFTNASGLPIVRFDNGVQRTVGRETWSISMGFGREASRTQVPLGLAWAISIHKSQGMSLSRVQVSLAKVFECGQAYVALSRARTLEGLEILDFNPGSIRAHPVVINFYRNVKTPAAT